MGQKSSYGGKIGILYIDFVLLGASLLFFFLHIHTWFNAVFQTKYC